MCPYNAWQWEKSSTSGWLKDWSNYEPSMLKDIVTETIFPPPARWLSLDSNKGATPSLLLLHLCLPRRSLLSSSQLRTLWATPGPELHIVSSGYCGHAWARKHAKENARHNARKDLCQKEYQKMCQKVCQNWYQIECQNVRMNFRIGAK